MPLPMKPKVPVRQPVPGDKAPLESPKAVEPVKSELTSSQSSDVDSVKISPKVDAPIVTPSIAPKVATSTPVDSVKSTSKVDVPNVSPSIAPKSVPDAPKAIASKDTVTQVLEFCSYFVVAFSKLNHI